MTQTAVKIEGLRHAWPGEATILDIESFELGKGESLFLAGPSGSGKSTLLGLIAGITPVQHGRITVLDEYMDPASPAQRDRLRADSFGMVFQLFNLVPYLTPTENVLLPLTFSSRRADAVKATGRPPAAEAHRLMTALGLPKDAQRKPTAKLSVGQQQRVAAARALIGSPGLIIADEPTSALDEDSRDNFLDLLSQEARTSGAALLFVSHERTLAQRFDRALELDVINAAGSRP